MSPKFISMNRCLVIMLSIRIKTCNAKFSGIQMTKFDKMPHFVVHHLVLKCFTTSLFFRTLLNNGLRTDKILGSIRLNIGKLNR